MRSVHRHTATFERMRLAFIADGRAEHTRRWLSYFSQCGDEVLLLSTYPCDLDLPNLTTRTLPGVFRPGNTFVKSSKLTRVGWRDWVADALARSGLDRLIRPLWYHLTVLDVPLQALVARRIVRRYKPDVLHVMRIQNEGYVAALAGYQPWILSAWGQDIVFFARHYRFHRYLTKATLRAPSAYTADCQRDICLARELGLPQTRPTRLFPSNGGVRLDEFQPGVPAPQRASLIVYPRGLGQYLRFETLLAALRLLVQQGRISDVKVVLLGPPGLVRTMEKQVRAYSLPLDIVNVRAFVSRQALGALLGRAAIMVSPSISDGTPNSLLEAMACGAFPVVGDIDSVREWIVHERNGLLFDPNNPQALAECLQTALRDPDMRQAAQNANLKLVQKRADYSNIMPAVRVFYEKVARRSR